jgi:hypothetical protein
MSKETKLISVPTFTFNQGDIYGDADWERPINVDFYNGSIVLRQDGEYDIQEEILIHPKYLDAIFRAIKKHKIEAEKLLEMRNKN